MRNGPEAKRMVSARPEDDGGHGEEECVVLDLVEYCRSKFKNFDLESTENSAMFTMGSTVDSEGDPGELCWEADNKR